MYAVEVRDRIMIAHSLPDPFFGPAQHMHGATFVVDVAFFRETQEASMMAFATASSNATLPTSLRVADTRLKLPPRIARFVLTIGATLEDWMPWRDRKPPI